jgi:hypothetical protein
MTRAIALDTNVLALLIVGLTSKDYIQKHGRTRQFTKKDFDVLLNLLECFNEAVVTPNVLSELSNLLDEGYDPMRSQIWRKFRYFIEGTKEIYLMSGHLSDRSEFIRLGVADYSMLELAKQRIAILSTDGALCRAALGEGYNAQNFTDLTEAAQV